MRISTSGSQSTVCFFVGSRLFFAKFIIALIFFSPSLCPAVDFFNEISLLYGTITEFCTPQSCPQMNAGPKCVLSSPPAFPCPNPLFGRVRYEYLWADGVKVKKPIKVSAPEYVDLLMSWVEAQLNDETIFPLQIGTFAVPAPKAFFIRVALCCSPSFLVGPLALGRCDAGTPFPKHFRKTVEVIFKRLFRVYAHIYHCHFDKIVGLGAEAHLNTCFKHFIFFVNEFKLVDVAELAPLQDLIDTLMGKEVVEGKEEPEPEEKDVPDPADS